MALQPKYRHVYYLTLTDLPFQQWTLTTTLTELLAQEQTQTSLFKGKKKNLSKRAYDKYKCYFFSNLHDCYSEMQSTHCKK